MVRYQSQLTIKVLGCGCLVVGYQLDNPMHDYYDKQKVGKIAGC